MVSLGFSDEMQRHSQTLKEARYLCRLLSKYLRKMHICVEELQKLDLKLARAVRLAGRLTLSLIILISVWP